MSTQWKDRAIALERQLKELDNEARTRIDLAIERNMELERQVQDAQYTIIMLQRRLNEGSVDINPPPVPPVAEFDNVADAQAYIAQRQEEGGRQFRALQVVPEHGQGAGLVVIPEEGRPALVRDPALHADDRVEHCGPVPAPHRVQDSLGDAEGHFAGF